jgi:hypothetical protein
MSRSRGLVVAVLALLGGATVYELCVALRLIDLGSLPGEGPPGGVVVGFAAAVGFVGAAVVAETQAASSARLLLAALLAPCAATFLVAHYYTFDPYYLPTLLRYAGRGFLPATVVFALAAAGLIAGIASWVRPRLASPRADP